MMLDDFLSKFNNSDDIELIKKAYDFAYNVVKDSKRKNGDLAINHFLEVANILIDLNVDIITLLSSILHEVIDYDDETGPTLEKEFGKQVFSIVNSLSKINCLEMVDDSEDSALYLRKVMVGLCDDVRVLFIKLADRLHNLRTMECFSHEHQKKVANETLTVLVPIAHRLGINSIKSELENLCLYYLKPEVYNDILEKLNNTVGELNDYLISMKDSISKLLADNDIKFEIKGRVKSVYSIYNKLTKGRKWEDIYDILALRIFVENERDCYAVIGIIHSKYRPVQERFKDFIAVPKENMYQSLHTTIIGEGGRFYEVQIRTYEMDEIAEKGLASHWSYKEKGTKKIQTMMEQKLELYRTIIENSDNDDHDFVQMVDREILSDLIYVFTPKGDVVELPKGSTPIDFAYRIHSKIGDKMVGAIVNDKMVPINSQLQEDDIVKILTSPSAKPNKDWLNIVKTRQAQDKIKAYFSKISRSEYENKGKEIFDKELRRRKIIASDILNSDNIKKILDNFKLKDLDDMYLSIGSFRLTASSIISFILNEDKDTHSFTFNKSDVLLSNGKSDILVDNKTSIQTHLAKCCNPVMGDNIIGLITKNEGIAIHRSDCINIKDRDEKIINVSWTKELNYYYAKVLVIVNSDKNKLSDLVGVFTSENISIADIDIQDNNYYLTIKVKNKNELEHIINKVNSTEYVKEATRI